MQIDNLLSRLKGVKRNGDNGWHYALDTTTPSLVLVSKWLTAKFY